LRQTIRTVQQGTKDSSVQTNETKTKMKSVKTQCLEPTHCNKCIQKPALIKITKRNRFMTHSKSNNTDLSFSPFEKVVFSTAHKPSTSTPVKDFDLDLSFETPEKQCKEELEDQSYVNDSEDQEDESEKEFDCNETIVNNDLIAEPKFLVFWSCLLSLFTYCKICFQRNVVDKVTFKGTLLTIKTICANDHEFEWKSQPEIKNTAAGNILLSGAILYSGSTFARVTELLKMINVVHFSSSRIFEIQKTFLFPALNKLYNTYRTDLYKDCLNSTENHFSGDGRCDSPGYSAKYGTYSLMNTVTNKHRFSSRTCENSRQF